MDMVEDADTLEEQEDIIMKYEKGHRAGLPEDMGPEPVGIYNNIDRFGIVHETKLPPVSAREAKQMRREMRRVNKWMKMLGQWETYKNSKKLMKRVYKGIPMNVRMQVWSVLLNIQEIKAKNPRKFQEGLCAQGSSFGWLLQMLNDQPNPSKGPRHPGLCWLHMAGRPSGRGTGRPLPAHQPGSSSTFGQLPRHGHLVLRHPVLVGLSGKTPTMWALRVCPARPWLREDLRVPGDSCSGTRCPGSQRTWMRGALGSPTISNRAAGSVALLNVCSSKDLHRWNTPAPRSQSQPCPAPRSTPSPATSVLNSDDTVSLPLYFTLMEG
ncbi:uncharacterized protein LOC101017930 isoform X2 [Papio anubis]|uniref:uncharacterized protein LOC101017930 isoform X2 n=1 Tax=Papio anubis TaxID=9555 RepID=UPI0012ADF671|nr:uncharacterized protein LOC101017930 isoform X2 [Papio anubis]XP_017805975.2 uncharacterized protein LOC101017930 isoform X2 [Papio anubis]